MKKIIQHVLWEKTKQIVPFHTMLEFGKEHALPVRIEKNPGDEYFNTTIPFWYGEYPHHINPADNMGWDVIVSPKSNTAKNLKVVGVVPVHPEADHIPKPHGNKPGNHKLILSSNETLDEDEKQVMKQFFSVQPSFLTPVFFDEKPIKQFLEENWEKDTFGKYTLGHFHDKSTKGIAVGQTARKFYGATSMDKEKPTYTVYN